MPYELFVDRFPRYALHLPFWEEVPLLKSAKVSPQANTEVLYLLGLGDGSAALALESWLKENPKRRLIFLEEKAGRIAAFLRLDHAKEVLKNSQVELFELTPQLLDELAWRYPYNIEIKAGSKEKKGLARLRLELLRKTAIAQAFFLESTQGNLLFSNLVKNLRRLPTSFYVNEMKGAFSGIPAIICGAGPSLASSFEELKKNEGRALIFAGGSAIAALAKQGISPHFALAIDPNADELERLKSCNIQAPLLFTLRLLSDALVLAKGPTGYVRSAFASASELWLHEAMGLEGALIGEDLPLEASSVTLFAVAVAVHFGCNPIILDGVDLAYTEGKRYADGVMAHGEKQPLQPMDQRLFKKDRLGRRVQTAVRWIMEAEALAAFAKKQNSFSWINCTQGGLPLRGFQQSSLSQVLKGIYKKDLEKLVQSAMTPISKSVCEKAFLKIEEMKKSLISVVGYLDQICTGKAVALAEIELEEELAWKLFFSHLKNYLSVEEIYRVAVSYLS